VKAPVRGRQGHARERADRPDRIEVAQQQNPGFVGSRVRRFEGSEVRGLEFCAQVIAAGALGDAGHAAADRLEPRGELVSAPVDGRLVVGRRFEADQRFDRLEQPAALGAAEFLKVV